MSHLSTNNKHFSSRDCALSHHKVTNMHLLGDAPRFEPDVLVGAHTLYELHAKTDPDLKASLSSML